MTMTKAEIEGFREYVASKKWKNAKTFAKFAPHEYVLSFSCEVMIDSYKCFGKCDKCNSDREKFEKYEKMINEKGELISFMRKNYKVICLDNHQYWMDYAKNGAKILNRAIINDPRCKIKTYWLER